MPHDSRQATNRQTSLNLTVELDVACEQLELSERGASQIFKSQYATNTSY